MSNDRLKFRQFYEGKFHYWGVGVDGCSFVGPASGGPVRADNTPNDQWTGLYDSEGVEIYEGDIIEGDDGFHDLVVFKENRFILEPLGDDCIYWEKSKVIGNIHESPDLMERPNG